MLKFSEPKCPHCGKPVAGVLQTIQGKALVLDGEWQGETEVDWDSQQNTVDCTGKVTVNCEGGHEWKSSLNEE